jgi:hypothetical protein
MKKFIATAAVCGVWLFGLTGVAGAAQGHRAIRLRAPRR